ncbi:Ubiquitin-conjugating enzyme E2 6 [Entophlyctis luteolus]|nr:Ubiquitin-conjugating enzyme E2 6 [Entophlyctis luteolus]
MSKQATKRLQKEYSMMMANPPEFIVARPLESNILVWHYIVTGPPDSPYEGGEYHGKVVFPEEYPYKPPSIRMLTPNDTRLCLSMSDYHPGTWNPAWSVATILTGLLSFMLEETPTTGSVVVSMAERRALAKKSKQWNRMDARFIAVWPDIIEKDSVEEEEIVQDQDTREETVFYCRIDDIPNTEESTPHSAGLHKRNTPAGLLDIAPSRHVVPQAPRPQQHVSWMQVAVDRFWERVRSSIWLLLFGGVMMYLVVLKVMAKLM